MSIYLSAPIQFQEISLGKVGGELVFELCSNGGVNGHNF